MKNSNPDNTPMPGTEPNTISQGINPSAPTAGTEGYGTASDEKNIVPGNPTASHPEQKGAGDTRHTSYPRNEAADNPAAAETTSRSQQLANNPNARGGKSFHCSDVGPANCNWSVNGSSEQEIMTQIEQHGRESHGIEHIDDKLRSRIHDAIQDRAA